MNSACMAAKHVAQLSCWCSTFPHFLGFKNNQNQERRNSRELHESKVRQYRFLSWSLRNTVFFSQSRQDRKKIDGTHL